MIIAEHIFVMLLTQEKFRSFTPHPICDATKTRKCWCACLETAGSMSILHGRGGAGCRANDTQREPQDHGFMYAHAFQDLDGHIWELVHMNPAAIGSG